MSRADFRSELIGGLNAPLGVEDSRRHQSVRRTTEKRLDVRLDRTGQAFDEVHCAGEPVAVVVGETRDQAAHAGTLIEVEYAVDPPVVFSPPIARDAVVPPQRMWPLVSSSGDAGKAIADAPVKIETVYAMADRDHDYSTTVPP
jgi:CO/xanthine dehydrogenase Mo-binding subunit